MLFRQIWKDMKKSFSFCVLTALLLSLSGCRSRGLARASCCIPKRGRRFFRGRRSAGERRRNRRGNRPRSAGRPLRRWKLRAPNCWITRDPVPVHGDGEGGGLPHSQNRRRRRALQLSGAAGVDRNPHASRRRAKPNFLACRKARPSPNCRSVCALRDALLQSRVQTLFECKS